MQHHIQTIEIIKNEIIDIMLFLPQKKHTQFKDFINEKFNNYQQSFKKIFNPQAIIKKDMEYFADVRSLAKYNENLISGWLIEDLFMYIFNMSIFKEYGFEIKINNHDSDRIIKKRRDYINSDPDYIISFKKIEFKLEIQALLIKFPKFHIKKNKADRIINNNSFLYHFNLYNQNIFFFNHLDIRKLGKLTRINAFGGKEGYEYQQNQIPFNKKLKFNKHLINKIIITLYWFYLCKKYTTINFQHKLNEITTQIKTIENMLKMIKDSKY